MNSVTGSSKCHEPKGLLNTGPRPDGSIPPDHEQVLRALGKRIRTEGWPAPGEPAAPPAPPKTRRQKKPFPKPSPKPNAHPPDP